MSEPGSPAIGSGIITKVGPRTVPDTVSRLTELLRANGLKLFSVIDQRAEAPRGRTRVARHQTGHLR